MSPPKDKTIEPIDADFEEVADSMLLVPSPSTPAPGYPLATHKANFRKLFGVDVDYYVLKDKRRLISKTGMAAGIGQKSPRGNTLMRVIDRQGISKYVGAELREKLENPIIFQTPDTGAALIHGYEAEILIDLCNAILQADRAEPLQASQRGMVMQAQIVVGATAKGGIIHIGDLLAGYDASRREYIELYKDFIRNEARKWEPEFFDDYYDLFYRLYKLDKTKYKNHPSFFAHLTRKYVYQPLANSNGAILENLDEKNPVIYKSGRRYKLHQFLDTIGVKSLRAHLGQIVGIGKLSKDKGTFERNFETAFGKQTEFDFGD